MQLFFISYFAGVLLCGADPYSAYKFAISYANFLDLQHAHSCVLQVQKVRVAFPNKNNRLQKVTIHGTCLFWKGYMSQLRNLRIFMLYIMPLNPYIGKDCRYFIRDTLSPGQ
jgi:hypothetical protein